VSIVMSMAPDLAPMSSVTLPLVFRNVPRVIENPTCRWSTWDAIRAGIAPSPHLETTIQERAYTSPIWFIPTRAT
jgi:hypothetical protein